MGPFSGRYKSEKKSSLYPYKEHTNLSLKLGVERDRTPATTIP